MLIISFIASINSVGLATVFDNKTVRPHEASFVGNEQL